MVPIISRYIFIFCTLILINAGCLSQSSSIYGYVTDLQNDSVISRAKVSLFTPDGKTFETVTNSIGYFSFDGIIGNLNSIILLLVEADNYLNVKSKLQTDYLKNDNRVNFQMTSAITKTYLPILTFRANEILIDSNDYQKINIVSDILIDNDHINFYILSYYDSKFETKKASLERASRVTDMIAIDSSLASRLYITHICDSISEIRFSIR